MQCTIAARFQRIADDRRDALALLQDGAPPLTYGDLAARTAALASRLSASGIGPGSFVAICAGRSWEAIVAIVAIVRAGGAYVPLDPAYPDAQLREMLRDVQPAVVLADPAACQRMRDLLCEDAVQCPSQVWNLADCATQNGDDLKATALPSMSPEDPAYIMFTSGSTGRPKGVVVPHRAVMRLVVEQDYCDLGADEVMLHLAPLNFDASTLEIWGALLNGGALAIVPDPQPSATRIGAAIEHHKVSTAWLTAGLFHLMVDEEIAALSGLRQLLAGGDVLSPDHVRRFIAAAPDCRLINGYGPTENTTFTCCATLTGGEWPCRSAPIGRAIRGTRVFVVDEQLRPVVAGEEGQLAASGEGLAIGYLANPELTAQRFVTAPSPIDQRVYLTGDLVRELPDGQIEFLGRIDRQVKIDGRRVEPGEIEQALRGCPDVQDAAVVIRQTDAAVLRILGFVVADRSSIDAIRTQAKAKLPRHMQVSTLQAIASLPVTANGKIDRDALLALDTVSSPVLSGALTKAEEQVAQLWRDVLGVQAIGRDEPFFDLGGRSLQLMRVHKGLERLAGRKIAVADLFSQPTVRAMAALTANARTETDPAALVGEAAASRAQLRREALRRRGRNPAKERA